MEKIYTMWCIKNQSGYISPSSAHFYKRDAIREWIKGSGESWEYWRDKFGNKAVKVLVTIKEIEK